MRVLPSQHRSALNPKQDVGPFHQSSTQPRPWDQQGEGDSRSPCQTARDGNSPAGGSLSPASSGPTTPTQPQALLTTFHPSLPSQLGTQHPGSTWDCTVLQESSDRACSSPLTHSAPVLSALHVCVWLHEHPPLGLSVSFCLCISLYLSLSLSGSFISVSYVCLMLFSGALSVCLLPHPPASLSFAPNT